MIVRSAFLSSLIGIPWVANARGPDAYDCYYLTKHVEKVLFNRELPDVDVPNCLDWNLIIKMIDTSPERKLWKERPTPAGQPIYAADGAIVLMAASHAPAHLGVWCSPERSIIHTDKDTGVVFDDLMTIKMIGWHRLLFYEPIDE